MGTWDMMGDDLRRLVLHWRRRLMLERAASTRVQSAMRSWRTRVLLKRYVAHRFLRDFCVFNPSASIFLARSRL
jgi:hypothetical protein